MRWRIAWAVYRKEMRETLRDRRTLIMMIALPILLYPLLILALSFLQESQMKDLEARTSTVAVWGDAPAPLIAMLQQRKFRVLPGDGLPGDLRTALASGKLAPVAATLPKGGEAPETALSKAAREHVLARKVDAVLAVWPDTANGAALGHVAVLFDSVRPESDKAAGRLNDALRDHRQNLLAERETKHKLPTGFTQALAIGLRDLATKTRRAGFGLGMILPFLLVITPASAAFYAAIDATAGEKERNTMQTLLCAPVSPLEIVTGKFFAVWTVALMASLANVGSMAGTFGRLAKGMPTLTIGPATYLIAFAMLAPVTLMLAALFVAVGAFAKDFKDGQNLMTPVLIAPMFPLGATMIPGIELNAATAFAPILNIALLMKASFVGEARPDTFFLTMLSSVMYAALSVVFAARVFERASVLVGGGDTFRGLFGLDGRARRATPGVALSVFAVAVVLGFYVSLGLEKRSLLAMLVVLQYGCFLAPVLAAVYFLKLPARETLSLRAPHWGAIAGAVVLGLSTWAFAGGISTRLLPPPESLVKALQKLLQLGDQHMPLAVVLFAVALTPAICEELLFRGLVLSGLRPLGMRTAIVASSLLFAVAHASVYRLLPTFLIGLVLGYVAWRSGSVFPGMLIHALNNGLMAVLSERRWLPGGEHGLEASQTLPWSWVLAGGVAMAAGLWLVSSRRPATRAGTATS